MFLGDLVDRGPDCRGVIQRLIDGINAIPELYVLGKPQMCMLVAMKTCHLCSHQSLHKQQAGILARFLSAFRQEQQQH